MRTVLVIARTTRITSTLGRSLILLLAGLGLTATGCGSTQDQSDRTAGTERPTVVVTTSILGDVVTNVVGEDADVEVVMPPGTDPHEFEASARQVAEMSEADIIITNGLGFEANLSAAVDAARQDGVPVYEVGPDVDPQPFPPGFTEDEDHTTETGDQHADEPVDPHFFTDPERVADGAENIAATLGDEAAALDTPGLRDRATAYADQIRSTSDRIADELSAIPGANRKLVTNHEVFGYFADRYDFEVIGTVVPSGTTLAEPSSQDLANLAATIQETGVPALFADSSSPTQLADALAEETGVDVQVVTLFSESLGGPNSGAATYLEMIQTNADRITAALS